MEEGLEDIACVECVPQFPFERKVLEPLENECEGLWTNDGPELHGEPHLRWRMHGAVWNKASMIWVGPPPQDWQRDFEEKFHRAHAVDCTIFLQADKQQVWQDVELMLHRRGHYIKMHAYDQLRADEALDLMCPPYMRELVAQHLETTECKQALEAGKPWAIDAEQGPGTGSSPGLDWPSQLTHGTVMVFTRVGPGTSGLRVRLASKLEHAQAMGWNVLCDEYPLSPLCQVLQQLKPYEVKALVGNGMSLRVECAFMMYILSNLVRRRHWEMIQHWPMAPQEEEEFQQEI